MQGVHVLGKEVTGGFVGKHRNREWSKFGSLLDTWSLDHSPFLSGFGSPLRLDQASLDLNIHRWLKIQVPGVLHRWPRCCVVHLVHLTPKRQLNFPICLFDIVNLHEFAICEFQLVAQLFATWVFLKATSIFWVGGLLLHGPVGTRRGFVRSSFKFLHGGEWHSARKKCRVHFGKVFGEICGPMPKRSLRPAFLLFLFQKSKLRKRFCSKHIAILWRDWILWGRASWYYHRRRDTSLGGTWSHFHGLCWNHMKHIDIHRYMRLKSQDVMHTFGVLPQWLVMTVSNNLSGEFHSFQTIFCRETMELHIFGRSWDGRESNFGPIPISSSCLVWLPDTKNCWSFMKL